MWTCLGSLGNISADLTFLQSASPVPNWCASPGAVTYRETVGPTNSPGLAHSFWNPLRLNWVFQLPRSSWSWRENSFRTNLSWITDSPGTGWIESVPSNYLTTVAMLTGHCIMGRHAERMSLPFNDFCRGCRSIEEEETVFHFLCQCPSLARYRYRLFGSPFLVSLGGAIIYW